MKIRFLDRIILFFGGVLTILAGAALFVAGLQIQGVLAEGMPLWARVLCLVFGIVIASFGGYLIAFPRRYAVKRHEFVVQKTENGELRIAVKAIENLVQKCIDLHEEIDVLSMKILNSREGVVVVLSVSLANNISIPLAIASLQKQIKQYLIASSGIEVKEVRVSVESTQDALPPETEEEAEEAAPEKPAAKEKKLPLHQRLFGRPEQPAIVPEPPKEETEEAPHAEEAEADPWKRPDEPRDGEADAPVLPEETEETEEAPVFEAAPEENGEAALAPRIEAAPEQEEADHE